MRHFWNDADDLALGESVEAMLPFRDALAGTREVWWGAVAAETMRRLGCADIGPHAARSRWEMLARREREANKIALARQHDAMLDRTLAGLDEADTAGTLPESRPEDGWERTIRAGEEWEGSLAESTHDGVAAIRLDLDRLVSVVEQFAKDVAALRREWEGTA